MPTPVLTPLPTTRLESPEEVSLDTDTWGPAAGPAGRVLTLG